MSKVWQRETDVGCTERGPARRLMTSSFCCQVCSFKLSISKATTPSWIQTYFISVRSDILTSEGETELRYDNDHLRPQREGTSLGSEASEGVS